MTFILKPSVQRLYDTQKPLDTVKDRKQERKLKAIALEAWKGVIPDEMADAINQIEDKLLRSKVAGLVSFCLGDDVPGIYFALKPIMKLYPRGCVIEPEPEEVYNTLMDLGFSMAEAGRMSTVN
jgi:hypothetical protein